MAFVPPARFCHSPEPMIAHADDLTMASPERESVPLAVTVNDLVQHRQNHPFYPHQRGRRRSPAPVPPAYFDPSVPLSLAMTASHPSAHPPRPSHHVRPRPRQQTRSGGSGTFRGRRRHRSPSLGIVTAATAAAATAFRRKASARPQTPSPSMSRSCSMRNKSRTLSRQSARLRSSSRGGDSKAREESPSPRRRAFRAAANMDHGMYQYNDNWYQQPKGRHCQSRPGSVDGSKDRRRWRQRTSSHSRPHTGVGGGDGVDGGGYYVFGDTTMMPNASAIHVTDRSRDEAPSTSRLQFHMLFTDSSGTNSDRDAVDVEMG